MTVEKKYTPKELAESVVFPVELTDAQKKEAATQLEAVRKRRQHDMSDREKLILQLLQLKFQLEKYLEDGKYDVKKNFGFFLKKYIDILELRHKAFAQAISIDVTLLSQLINKHRDPPEYLFIRLELHSNKKIPAEYWFKLVEKEKVHQIKTDKKLRTREKAFVLSTIANIS
ncbi:hypothetical protein [Chitinophaga sp. sic0106]|uniref:hypothetical protein n=1 Tax=Chitinophaga sp. sic0106 TaxID=2854785 RepID=UPI001C472717|nr:hypothetical protein [Chitinophaga sp. sic0106]MBV7532342.1 hypothetical protein [Chitinophaga sp. sic0106]